MPVGLTREELCAEGPLPKFLRYVRVHTTSDPAGAEVPTTPQQLDLSRMLAAECREMGLGDVVCDARGIVTATIPASGGHPPSPVLGLLAHVDTSPAVPGDGVSPIVHRAYAGGPIRLPAGLVLDPAEHPALAEVAGHDLVTSDGRTLLGADDKAGVAEIMAAAGWWRAHPEAAHGRIRIAFTTDEETGRGIEFLDPGAFGADIAYTLDGGALGEISWENFNAENVRAVITGRSSHTGSARGHMVNAVSLAAQLVGAIPPQWRPETTSGPEGFVHCDSIAGDVERVELVLLLRDFEDAGLAGKRRWLEGQAAQLEAGYPGAQVRLQRIGGYRNMRGAVAVQPRTYELAMEAMRQAGVTPRPSLIRGGTDGARLSERGLPTPNLFAGGMDFHSRTEWISVQWMERAVATILALAELWGREAAPGGRR